MIKSKTIWHFSEQSFNEDLEKTLNEIVSAGGKILHIANGTYSEQKTNGWGSLIADFRTVWTCIVTYEIDD